MNHSKKPDSLFLAQLLMGQQDEMSTMINVIDESEQFEADALPELMPILPIKNTVLFPGVVIPITVGRAKSIRLVKKVYKQDRIIGVITQRNDNEDPNLEDLYRVGTVAQIVKMLQLPDGNTTIIIQGKRRFQLDSIETNEPYLQGRYSLIKDKPIDRSRREFKAMIQTLRDSASRILRLNPEIPQEAQIALDNIESPFFLVHFLSSNLNADVVEKQQLLESEDTELQAQALLRLMMREVSQLELKQEIQSKVQGEFDSQQRDYYIRQQIKILQDELGDSTEKQVDALRLKASTRTWSETVNQHFERELEKLGRINPMSPEYGVQMNYLETMVDLPWGIYTKDSFNLKRAKKVLDADHYGIEEIKERILEYLAVLKLKGNMKAPILCLYGPPGVGKTSLGRSIASALNRKYIRMSLGGLHDEAEIRGHRKTYIGAMPGKILQQLKKVGSSNPVFILDEIDKLGNSYHGDPSSALLEVLDPEQNATFQDNYLELEFDLSKIMFIATANSLDSIQPALRDRMEIIDLSGYTLEEKSEIAKRHLIPKQAEENGLKKDSVKFEGKALNHLIEAYTRESGVRNLERQLGKVCRKLAVATVNGAEVPNKVDTELVEKYLGAPMFEAELFQENDVAGIVVGLAWTPVGGDILFIESTLYKGRGGQRLSGQLGDVMKESAQAAYTYLKANASSLNIPFELFDNYEVHVHVPAGAVPKDGPSAGITMLTSLASSFTQRKVKSKLAMTGEITLRGKVLPVGGIKEKILAAKRAGIKEIILPARNKKDVEEINASYIKDLTIHFVENAEQVLKLALLPEQVKRPVDLSHRADNQGMVMGRGGHA